MTQTPTHAIIVNNNDTFSVALLSICNGDTDIVTTFGEYSSYSEAVDAANKDAVERTDSLAVIGDPQVETPTENVATIHIPAGETKDVITLALRRAAKESFNEGHTATANRFDAIAEFIDQQNTYSKEDCWLYDV